MHLACSTICTGSPEASTRLSRFQPPRLPITASTRAQFKSMPFVSLRSTCASDDDPARVREPSASPEADDPARVRVLGASPEADDTARVRELGAALAMSAAVGGNELT